MQSGSEASENAPAEGTAGSCSDHNSFCTASTSTTASSQPDMVSASQHRPGRAPRTSFTYTSRASSAQPFASPFGQLAPAPPSAAPAAQEKSSTLSAPGPSATPRCVSCSVLPSAVSDASTRGASCDTSSHAALVSATAPASAPLPQKSAPAPPHPPPAAPAQIPRETAVVPAAETSLTTSTTALGRMDESQMRAATFGANSPLLLQAGAGSGKTQTMAARFVHLLESGVPSRSIVGICFTRQAAETLRERVRSALPPHLAIHARMLKLKTFHSFGLECLRRFGAVTSETQIVDARQQRKIAEYVVVTYATKEKSKEAVTDLLEYIDRVKSSKAAYPQHHDPHTQVVQLFHHYERVLHEEHNAVDFGDLQKMFYELLRPVPAETPATEEGQTSAMPPSTSAANNAPPGSSSSSTPSSSQQQSPSEKPVTLVPSPTCQLLRELYSHYVVDEFQDFSELQMEMLALLVGDECRVTCVGDPNQCIYTWRGALPNIFLVWKRRFPQTTNMSLAMNYRSDAPIVDAINKVVRSNQLPFYHRDDRNVTLVKCYHEDEEPDAVRLVLEHVMRHRDPKLTYGDVAILCRTRRRVDFYCKVLKQYRIPYRQLQATSVDRLSKMRALQALLRLCLSPHSKEGDEDVRTALTMTPLFQLPVGVTKKFFPSLDSVSKERRDAEVARLRTWRSTMDADDVGGVGNSNSNSIDVPTGAVPGIHRENFSYFAVLRDLVYHNFSAEKFPKLDLSQKSQKAVRRMVQLVVRAGEMLMQPTCDVEQVLLFVLRDAGFESESTATAAARGAARGNAGKRPRTDGAADPVAHPPSRMRAGTALMEQCAASYNSGQQVPPRNERRLSGPSSNGGNNSSSNGAATGDEDVLPPEEEAATWREQQMNLSELILYTYRSVVETLRDEIAKQAAIETTTTLMVALDADGANGSGGEASSHSCSNGASSRSRGPNVYATPFPARPPSAASADNSMSVFSNGSAGAVTPTRMQALCPPRLVLRRVLDEFVSLLPTDDYGPIRPATLPKPPPASGSAAPADKSEAGISSAPAEATTTTSAPRWVGEVSVGTVHRAKGMEWPVVLLPGCWDGEFPIGTNPEERRVFYVAMSRAMRHLFCFTAQSGQPGNRANFAAAIERMPGITFDIDDPLPLVPTPYMRAFEDEMDVLFYQQIKREYLEENGYI